MRFAYIRMILNMRSKHGPKSASSSDSYLDEGERQDRLVEFVKSLNLPPSKIRRCGTSLASLVLTSLLQLLREIVNDVDLHRQPVGDCWTLKQVAIQRVVLL